MVENDAVLTNPVSVRAPHGFEVKLCRNLKLVSSGGGAAAWMGYHVGPVLPGLAPHIESLVVHMVHDEQESANLNHRLSIQFSADGFNWDGTAIVLSSSSSLGYRIGSDYSTETSLSGTRSAGWPGSGVGPRAPASSGIRRATARWCSGWKPTTRRCSARGSVSGAWKGLDVGRCPVLKSIGTKEDDLVLSQLQVSFEGPEGQIGSRGTIDIVRDSEDQVAMTIPVHISHGFNRRRGGSSCDLQVGIRITGGPRLFDWTMEDVHPPVDHSEVVVAVVVQVAQRRHLPPEARLDISVMPMPASSTSIQPSAISQLASSLPHAVTDKANAAARTRNVEGPRI